MNEELKLVDTEYPISLVCFSPLKHQQVVLMFPVGIKTSANLCCSVSRAYSERPAAQTGLIRSVVFG